mmetsp:Transcript_2838/g.17665  ORF Transcript_2838/g.17665 Transcript_2838/m.17665 type:complete len:111 (-) Transcript_2838:63-395(-)
MKYVTFFCTATELGGIHPTRQPNMSRSLLDLLSCSTLRSQLVHILFNAHLPSQYCIGISQPFTRQLLRILASSIFTECVAFLGRWFSLRFTSLEDNGPRLQFPTELVIAC